MTKNHSTDNSSTGEDPLASYEIMKEWSRTWLRTISRVWEERGNNTSGCPGAFEELLTHDARKAFAEMGFSGKASVGGNSVSLWDFLDINVKPAEPNNKNQYIPPKDGNFDVNGWTEVINNQELKMTLDLQIPPAPESKWQALAVADYDAAGKVYPFTCCPV